MKAYEKVVIQDEQLAKWKRNKHGKRVHHSCMSMIKSKLKMLDNVVVLDKWIPTTKWCPCWFVNEDITEHDRHLTCPNCGKAEDRDVHSAKNMLAIYDLVISRSIVPRGTREVKLVDFRAATAVVAKDGERQVQKDEARRC